MESAKKLIAENFGAYPAFHYYVGLMEKAESNLIKYPDVCIEICKSLIEGVSRTVILDYLPDTELKKLNNMEVSPLTKWACQLLRQDNNVIEDEFVRRAASMTEFLGAIRNERGDISHGKQAPKPVQSDDKLASVIFQVSNGLLTYMLDGYFTTKRLARESLLPPPKNDDDLDENSNDLQQLEYDEQSDFNSWLDNQYPYDGKLTYSFSLYSLYYEDYLLRLENYRESAEGNDL